MIFGSTELHDEPNEDGYIDELTIGCCGRCNRIYIHEDGDLCCDVCARRDRLADRAAARKARKGGVA